MVDTWRGIFPITAFVRDALRRKMTSETEMPLSAPERTLLTACEFWASVTSGTLADGLQPNPVVHLSLAQHAFTQLGAFQVASKLRVALADLSQRPTLAATREAAAQLEDELVRIDDRVDDLIARFALQHIDMETPRR